MPRHIDGAAKQPNQRNGRKGEENGDVAALISVKAIPRPEEHFPHNGLRNVLFFGGVRLPP
jgi:prepilin-type processing-associated H-X9-DG protein